MAEQIGTVSQLKNGLVGAGAYVNNLRITSGSFKLASSNSFGCSISMLISYSIGGTSPQNLVFINFSAISSGAATARCRHIIGDLPTNIYLQYVQSSSHFDIYLNNKREGSLCLGGIVLFSYGFAEGLCSVVKTDSIGDDAVDFTEVTE